MAEPRPGTTIGRITDLEQAVARLIGDLGELRERLDTLSPPGPPKRDPASSTHLTTDRAWTAARRAPATGQAFGFSRPATPDHYLGGATVAEGYRDEKWQDATS